MPNSYPFLPENYTDDGEYKRLTADEKRTNKLRTDNRSLANVDKYDNSYSKRVGHKDINDFKDRTHTYYTEEMGYGNPRLGNTNLHSVSGGGFWDDFGRGFLMPFQAVGKIAEPIASVAKAIG